MRQMRKWCHRSSRCYGQFNEPPMSKIYICTNRNANGNKKNCSNIFVYCRCAFFKPLTLINTNKKYILWQIRANIYTVLYFCMIWKNHDFYWGQSTTIKMETINAKNHSVVQFCIEFWTFLKTENHFITLSDHVEIYIFYGGPVGLHWLTLHRRWI